MYISAGHSNVDPGACANGKREADIAVEFRNMVSFYLQRLNVRHELDANGTTNLPLGETVKRSRKHAVSVEFHCNASTNATATGVEVLCDPKDKKTASKICDAISTTLGIRNRGVKPENAGQHSRLAFVQAGGMIVELFFITNADDLARYESRKWVAAKAVAEALC